MSKKSTAPRATGLEIAVIGMAARFPKSRDIHQFWERLKNGEHCISFISDEELEQVPGGLQLKENPNYVNCRGGVLEDARCFDASFFDYTPGSRSHGPPDACIS